MEIKELKIQAPEGYEIDKENSTFECIKFKPVKKDITYNSICDKIFKNKTGYYISDTGNVRLGAFLISECDRNNALNSKQLEKLLALNQLLNIAEYYNRLHNTIINSTTIMYDGVNQVYSTSSVSTLYLRGVKAIFNSREAAQAVIDNPNFREILDTIYKD